MGRGKVDLDEHKSEITTWLDEGLNVDEMRRNLWKEHKIQISARTFTRRLREWDIYVKQPYLQDLPALRQRVKEIFTEGRLTNAQAVQQLKDEGFEVRGTTYFMLRKEMGLLKRGENGFKPLPAAATGSSEKT